MKSLYKNISCETCFELANTIAAPDGAPIGVTVIGLEETSADISWEPIDCNLLNGQLMQYQLFMYNADGSSRPLKLTLPGSDTKVKIQSGTVHEVMCYSLEMLHGSTSRKIIIDCN